MTLAPDDPRHGTVNGYKNLRCRCQECRKVWADHCRRYYQLNLAKGPRPAAACGTDSRYQSGCRCEACRNATKIARADRRYRAKLNA